MPPANNKVFLDRDLNKQQEVEMDMRGSIKDNILGIKNDKGTTVLVFALASDC